MAKVDFKSFDTEKFTEFIKDRTKTLDKAKILHSVSKVVDRKPKKTRAKCRVSSMKFWCVVCTSHYEIFRKAEDGSLELPQGICPHMILKSFEMTK